MIDSIITKSNNNVTVKGEMLKKYNAWSEVPFASEFNIPETIPIKTPKKKIPFDGPRGESTEEGTFDEEGNLIVEGPPSGIVKEPPSGDVYMYSSLNDLGKSRVSMWFAKDGYNNKLGLNKEQWWNRQPIDYQKKKLGVSLSGDKVKAPSRPRTEPTTEEDFELEKIVAEDTKSIDIPEFKPPPSAPPPPGESRELDLSGSDEEKIIRVYNKKYPVYEGNKQVRVRASHQDIMSWFKELPDIEKSKILKKKLKYKAPPVKIDDFLNNVLFTDGIFSSKDRNYIKTNSASGQTTNKLLGLVRKYKLSKNESEQQQLKAEIKKLLK